MKFIATAVVTLAAAFAFANDPHAATTGTTDGHATTKTEVTKTEKTAKKTTETNCKLKENAQKEECKAHH